MLCRTHQASRAGSKALAGYMYLLQVWSAVICPDLQFLRSSLCTVSMVRKAFPISMIEDTRMLASRKGVDN
jgi:hypothetical protein